MLKFSIRNKPIKMSFLTIKKRTLAVCFGDCIVISAKIKFKLLYFLEIVDRKKHADWFLEAEECKKHGLANQLRLPTMTIDDSVNVEEE